MFKLTYYRIVDGMVLRRGHSTESAETWIRQCLHSAAAANARAESPRYGGVCTVPHATCLAGLLMFGEIAFAFGGGERGMVEDVAGHGCVFEF